MIPSGSPDGLVGRSVIACHVVAGRTPHASVAASRNAAQSVVRVTHPATMLASELNVARASVDEPFGVALEEPGELAGARIDQVAGHHRRVLQAG